MFTDYLWREDKRSDALTAATVAPLFFGLATAPQARRVAAAGPCSPAVAGRSRHLHCSVGPAMGRAQWLGAAAMDGDRGPAPLRRARAREDHRRALDDQGRSPPIASTGKLVEKYNVADALVEAGGGEYPTQDGFGWTNGVLRRLLALYPDAVARDARTAWCPSAPANDDDAPPSGPATGAEPRPPREVHGSVGKSHGRGPSPRANSR